MPARLGKLGVARHHRCGHVAHAHSRMMPTAVVGTARSLHHRVPLAAPLSLERGHTVRAAAKSTSLSSPSSLWSRPPRHSLGSQTPFRMLPLNLPRLAPSPWDKAECRIPISFSSLLHPNTHTYTSIVPFNPQRNTSDRPTDPSPRYTCRARTCPPPPAPPPIHTLPASSASSRMHDMRHCEARQRRGRRAARRRQRATRGYYCSSGRRPPGEGADRGGDLRGASAGGDRRGAREKRAHTHRSQQSQHHSITRTQRDQSTKHTTHTQHA